MAMDSLGVFQVDSTLNLIQGCDNSSYSNITRILYPNSSFALNTETEMTASGDVYNYTFTNTETIGDYLVFGHCDELIDVRVERCLPALTRILDSSN